MIAPVIFVENWQELYLNLIKELESKLSERVKMDVFFEVIFMTYSYVHTKINEAAFPNRLELYDKELMTGRGKGKYWYKNDIREEGRRFFNDQMYKFFPNNKIEYIV